MRYASALVAVKNMDISKRFYRDVSGLQVTADFGANVTLEGGVILQTMDAGQSFTRTGQVFLSNIFGELYLEKEDVDSFRGRLKSFDIQYVRELLVHRRGQRVVAPLYPRRTVPGGSGGEKGYTAGVCPIRLDGKGERVINRKSL